MTLAYRLSRRVHSPRSGAGAKLYGGRWNPRGFEVIYAASSRSLAVLEILVHNSVLDVDYGVTEIQIPSAVAIECISDAHLPANWNSPHYDEAVQAMGGRWLREHRSAVLSVPSSVIKQERNFLLNPAHPDFESIDFGSTETFEFDSRLRRTIPAIL